MEHPGFFDRAGPFTLADVANATGANLGPAANPHLLIDDVRPLSDATSNHVSFIDTNKKYLVQLDATVAGACLVAPQLANRVPKSTAALVTPQPYHGFARALLLFYPQALHPMAANAGSVLVDPSAKLEEGVQVEAGAVIGPDAQIGRGTRIAANAVIGARCAIGRDSYVGAGATVTHALVGDRVS